MTGQVDNLPRLHDREKSMGECRVCYWAQLKHTNRLACAHFAKVIRVLFRLGEIVTLLFTLSFRSPLSSFTLVVIYVFIRLISIHLRLVRPEQW